MKTLPYKHLFYTFLLLLPAAVSANVTQLNGRYTKEKTIKKEFAVNSNALLKLENRFGNLSLSSWDENRVLIEVHIRTSGNNEEKVREKLEEITVEFEANAAMVSARTEFDSKRGNWNWGWGKRNNVSMQVNYIVRLPVKNSVNLSNDYGNITLDRVDGHAKINCDYGHLDIGELRGRNNQLNFDYTSKSSFGYINSASISADYSGFTIEQAGNLTLNADYTNCVITQMDNLEYTSDYGSLEVGEVKNVMGRGDYINVNLGTVHGNVDIAADYGSLEIKKISEEAGNINIQTDYTGVKIGYSPDYHFDFEVSTQYAGVSGKDDFEINISQEKGNKRYYRGYYGKAGSGNMVTISSDYGGISFKVSN